MDSKVVDMRAGAQQGALRVSERSAMLPLEMYDLRIRLVVPLAAGRLTNISEGMLVF